MPQALNESYDRLVFALLTNMDFLDLLDLSEDNFVQRNGEVYLTQGESSSEAPRGNASPRKSLQEMGGSRLATLYRKYQELHQVPLFGFIRPVVFSSQVKKILYTVGITREVSVHPKLAVYSETQTTAPTPLPKAKVLKPLNTSVQKALELVE